MLMAHPAVLQRLVEQYEGLRALHAETGTAESQQRLEDLSYTLCISTCTRDVNAALGAARIRISEGEMWHSLARPEHNVET